MSTMLSRHIQKFTTTVCRAAELATNVDAANQYRVQLAEAQGHVNGFVGGISHIPVAIQTKNEILI